MIVNFYHNFLGFLIYMMYYAYCYLLVELFSNVLHEPFLLFSRC